MAEKQLLNPKGSEHIYQSMQFSPNVDIYRPWIGKKNPSGDYDFKTYGELGTRINNLRGGMAQLGIQKDESVGLIINNSIEWAVIAFATYGLGARLVPMYENELEKTWKYIVEDSGITLLYVANQNVYDQVKGYVDEIETLEKIILIDGKGDGSMAGVEQSGEASPIDSIKPHYSDIAVLIYMTMNGPGGNLLGSVGRAIEKVTVKIDKSLVCEDSPDGEIVCFGPNVMQGYHNKPEQTAAVMVEDPELGAGFRTGDRGRLDENGYLFITGRFKEEYKLENGKYVHPASLEEEIKLNSYIANAMIYGEGKAYNVCMIVPDSIALGSYVESLGLSADNPNELVSDERVQNFLGSEVTNQLKTNYGGYEIPKTFMAF